MTRGDILWGFVFFFLNIPKQTSKWYLMVLFCYSDEDNNKIAVSIRRRKVGHWQAYVKRFE